MAKSDFSSVDEYIAAQPEASRDTLEKVRAIIRDILPAAKEVISYQIPAYKLDGAQVIYFSGWKEHYSLHPASAHLVATLKDEIMPYVAGKGTLRFPLAEPVPVKLIERVTRLRAEEVAEEQKARAAKPKRR